MTPPSGFLRRAAAQTFRDRREAGRALAGQLNDYGDRNDVVVFGLARGGVPVAKEVAAALRAPLDVFLVRKLGVPHCSELAMGALASGGAMVMNDDVLADLRVSDAQVREVIDAERAELARREHAYRGGRPLTDPRGRTVILVDDGVATGASMLVAVRAVRAADPRSIVVAVPVGPESACRGLALEADGVVCTSTPSAFEAVGQVYDDFHQVSDDEMRELLGTASG